MHAPTRIEVEDNAIEMTRRSSFGPPLAEGGSVLSNAQQRRSIWVLASPLALLLVGTLGFAASKVHRSTLEEGPLASSSSSSSSTSLRKGHLPFSSSTTESAIGLGIDKETQHAEAIAAPVLPAEGEEERDRFCDCRFGPSWECTKSESEMVDANKSACEAFQGDATCYCPPALAMWQCSRETFFGLVNGMGCAYFSLEHNSDYDVLSMRRAKMQFSQCLADIEGSKLSRDVCELDLQEKIDRCVDSVKERQAKGENIATGICDVGEAQAPEQLFFSEPSLEIVAIAEPEMAVAAAGGTAKPSAEEEKDYDCECPLGPSWKCTKAESRALTEAVCAPFKGRAACICPPALAIRECSRAEFKELLNGTNCPFYSLESNQDADRLAVRRAIAEFPQCLADVEGSKLSDDICERALQRVVDECERSVRERQAQGENIAIAICKAHDSPMQKLFASYASPEQLWQGLTA